MGAFSAKGLACVRGERTVFVGLDFSIGPGDAIVLTGANGSGKSSLLRLLAGLAPPAAGTIAWNQEDIRKDPNAHHARCHYVGHLDALKPVLTVTEQLTYWAALRGVSDSGMSEAILTALSDLGIAHLAAVPGRYLSAGQKRRVNLARILVAPATLWLLDEPRTALDDDAKRRLDTAIARHRANGGLVVLSMHGGDRPQGAITIDLTARSALGMAC
ncbi:MAG: heme ABC exporter ATP-binding protein CcmA [Rhodospirillales bacterium]|nr:heme ABC exporter ATP-binding protein CcmA [Rhodospirillales bacterium]